MLSARFRGGIVLKQFFSKSTALLLFSFSLSFVISLAGSLVWSVSNRPNTSSEDKDCFVISLAAGFFLILLLLNAVDIVLYWLRGKKKELYVKRLVGIERSHILKSLYINYALLTSMASILGSVSAFLCISACSNYLPLQVNFMVFLLSFLLCLIVLIIFCTVILLFTRFRREII